MRHQQFALVTSRPSGYRSGSPQIWRWTAKCCRTLSAESSKAYSEARRGEAVRRLDDLDPA